ncbi:MAG: hypothetical protein QNJ81_00100 [Acidimicrobiia bacterium]|nr:hypothetical protein [Acidimicrobiia bacterium]
MKFEVSGRPSHEETAAIAAVINAIVEEESRALATPAKPPRQSSWVLAWRPRDIPAPLPSHTYETQPWADVEPDASTAPE